MFTWRKASRKRRFVASDLSPSAPSPVQQELEPDFEQLVMDAPCYFNLQQNEQRIRLIDTVWAAGPASMSGQAIVDPQISRFLRDLLHTRYKERHSNTERQQRRVATHLDAMLINLVRCKSQFITSLPTAINAVAMFRAHTPDLVWLLVDKMLPGFAMSRHWAETFISDANLRRPPPKYELLPGVGGSFFDNYQRNLMYSTMVVEGKSGDKLNMCTNGDFPIPLFLARPNFDANTLCQCTPPFLTPPYMP